MKVSWGYYSQYMGSHKIHVPNHQPGKFSMADFEACGIVPMPEVPPPDLPTVSRGRARVRPGQGRCQRVLTGARMPPRSKFGTL